MNSNEIHAVEAFVAAINHHDIPDLSKLMTKDHTFVQGSKIMEADKRTGWSDLVTAIFHKLPGGLRKCRVVL